MTSHLLHLSTLHTAAPGILDVVFGPDGDFEGAPRWMGPVMLSNGMSGVRYVYRNPVDPLIVDLPASRDGALDLRVRTVAARLAGLCARALGGTGEGWRVVYVGMTWVLTDGLSQMFCWDALGRRRENTPPHLPPVEGRPFTSAAHFLAALTLALAPQIARLTQPRMP